MTHTPLRVAALLVAVAAATPAQSNLRPGTDVTLGVLGTGPGVNDPPRNWGRIGMPYPDGTIGVSVATTSCNVGTVDVPWISPDSGTPMGDDHPLIATLFARESDGRLVQISNYAAVKHGFFALTNEQCGGNCNQGPFGGGDVLGQGCSDTYGTFNNGDQYWLAPAEEIDPWLGTWDPFGSLFDTGQPDVGAPNNNDGQRSLSIGQVQNFNPVESRVALRDADLDVPGAEFFYQGYYVVRGEPEADRENNLRHRRTFLSTFTDPQTGDPEWSFSDGGGIDGGTTTNGLGSVLNRWDGATVTSAANGGDDGRVYVGVVVTDNGNGTWHYEYAVHNRDANRAVGAFRVPKCPESTVANFGFHDIDQDAGNDWAVSDTGTELLFSTESNPIRWNSFYNFWFDSDAAPEGGSVAYNPYFTGGGANLVAIDSTVPTGQFAWHAGDGCSFGTPPAIEAVGQATLGNASFAVGVTGNDPVAAVFAAVGTQPGSIPFPGGCTLEANGVYPGTLFLVAGVPQNATASLVPLPVPPNPALEGLTITVQAFSQRAGGGPLALEWDLSDALSVRLGDVVTGCP